MAIAYLVLAHRLPEQVGRLVGRLRHPDDLVWVHIDRKVDITPFRDAVRDGSSCRVDWAAERVSCHWGGYGIVAATLAGMRHALQVRPDVTHVVLLSGQDYPIACQQDIRGFFQRQMGRTFMFAKPAGQPAAEGQLLATNEDWWWNGNDGHLRRWHYRLPHKWGALPNRLTPFVPLRRLPSGLIPHQGSAFWAMDAHTAAYVLTYLDDRPAVGRFFSRSYIPDENIFQMIVMSGPRSTCVAQDDLHFIRWQPVHRTHPEVLRARDADAMLQSSKLFARKFDTSLDSEVLDLLDEACGEPPA